MTACLTLLVGACGSAVPPASAPASPTAANALPTPASTPTPAPSPTLSPSPSPSATYAPATATPFTIPVPTPLASPFASLEDRLHIRTVTLPESFASVHRVESADGSGPRMVFSELEGPSSSRGQQIWLVDIVSGTYMPLNEIEDRVATVTPRISGDDVVWTADRSDGTGGVAWELRHYDVASGSTNVVASGDNVRLEAGSPLVPAFDVDAGLVAYTVESPGAGRPLGWTIVVRRLSDGSIVRKVDTKFSLWDLRLDAGSLAWVEGPLSDRVSDKGAGVKVSLADGSPTMTVADSASRIALDGDRVVWATSADPLPNQPILDEEVFTTTLGDLASPEVLSRPSEGIIGARHPSAGEGLVAWNDSEFHWDSLAVWSAQQAQAYVLASHQNSFLTAIDGGWLTSISQSDSSVTMEDLLYISGIPVSELATAIAENR